MTREAMRIFNLSLVRDLIILRHQSGRRIRWGW